MIRLLQVKKKDFSHMKEKVKDTENSCLSRINISVMKSYEWTFINLKEKFFLQKSHGYI